MRRLKAIFSPTSVQQGVVNRIFAISPLIVNTLPPVDVDPMFTIKTSFLCNRLIRVELLSDVRTPTFRQWQLLKSDDVM
jgi:hypothetical protein